MKKTLFILLFLVCNVAVLKSNAQNEKSAHKITAKSKLDCSKCYFQSMEYSEGAKATLNSIWLFQCRSGKWIRIVKGNKNSTANKGIVSTNNKNRMDCKFCQVQSLYYSEGAIYSFGTQLNICRNGNWVPYSNK